MSAVEQEILDQPRCWRLAAQAANEHHRLLPPAAARVAAVGCGTSFYVAQAFAALREETGLGETDAFAASEMPIDRHYDQVLLITRSGTTSEVLDLVPRLPNDSRTLAVTTSDATAINATADQVIVLGFADEASIVQTRFATSTLALLRAHLGENIEPLVRASEQALAAPLPFDAQQFEQFVFIGRGLGAGLANEAALKLREVDSAWSESYPAMELRHGPMSSLGTHSIVWCLGAPPDGLSDEVKNTGATWVESTDDPMVTLTLVQRVAVSLALARGLDPDNPRFLTRSVILQAGQLDRLHLRRQR